MSRDLVERDPGGQPKINVLTSVATGYREPHCGCVPPPRNRILEDARSFSTSRNGTGFVEGQSRQSTK
jgi:hypothetical protein